MALVLRSSPFAGVQLSGHTSTRRFVRATVVLEDTPACANVYSKEDQGDQSPVSFEFPDFSLIQD